MTKENWALLIAGISLAVSVSGFVWSIFKEFIFVKPKISVGFAVFVLIEPGHGVTTRALGITVGNHGPGDVQVSSCITKTRSALTRKVSWGWLPNPSSQPDVQHPVHFPHKMSPGDVKTFYFPITSDGFLSQEIDYVGVCDTYGRNHFASRGAVRKARADYQAELQRRASESEA